MEALHVGMSAHAAMSRKTATHTISERGLASSALSIMMSPLAPTLPSFKNDGRIVFGNV
jgi:hypothetical protein